MTYNRKTYFFFASAAVKYDLDLQFDGLTIGAGSTFSYPKK